METEPEWTLLGEILASWFHRTASALAEAFTPIAKTLAHVIAVLNDTGLLKHPRRKHYHVAFRKRPISHKRAMIAQRKMVKYG